MVENFSNVFITTPGSPSPGYNGSGVQIITPEMEARAEGIKHDSDKTRYDLIDWPFVEGMANVMTANVGKHEDDTWKSIEPFRQKHFSALMRHVVKWMCGEKLDAETGMSHLYHAACRLMFLAWGDQKEK